METPVEHESNSQSNHADQCLELPERGAGPTRATGAHDRPRRSQRFGQEQHSPELLNLVKADEVLVVARSNSETRIGGMAEDQRDAVTKGLLRLGELMTTEELRLSSMSRAFSGPLHLADGRRARRGLDDQPAAGDGAA